MSEKRFIFATNEKRFNLDDESRIWDNGTPMTALDIVMMLNEQQATITNLQGDVERLKYIIEELRKDNYNKFELINKMKKEEKLYAKEILRLNELNKQTSEFTDILGGY